MSEKDNKKNKKATEAAESAAKEAAPEAAESAAEAAESAAEAAETTEETYTVTKAQMEQMEALAREVAQMRAELKQAGKKRELSISPPSLRTALSVSIWLALILLATMVGMVVLQTIWSGLAALWKVVGILFP